MTRDELIERLLGMAGRDDDSIFDLAAAMLKADGERLAAELRSNDQMLDALAAERVRTADLAGALKIATQDKLDLLDRIKADGERIAVLLERLEFLMGDYPGVPYYKFADELRGILTDYDDAHTQPREKDDGL